MEFTKVPIPTRTRRGRPALVNPYVDQFPTEEAIETVVEGFSQSSTEVRRLVRQARQAARDKGLRSFVHTVEFEDEVEGVSALSTRVTAWTEPKDEK